MNIFEFIAIIFALIITISLFISKNVRNRVNLISIVGLVLSLIIVTLRQGYLWYYSFLYIFAFIAVILFIIKSKKKLFYIQFLQFYLFYS